MSLRTFLLTGLVSFGAVNAAPIAQEPSFFSGVPTAFPTFSGGLPFPTDVFPGTGSGDRKGAHTVTSFPTGSGGLPFPTGGFLGTGFPGTGAFTGIPSAPSAVASVAKRQESSIPTDFPSGFPSVDFPSLSLPIPTGTGGLALPSGGFSGASGFAKRSNFHPKRQDDFSSGSAQPTGGFGGGSAQPSGGFGGFGFGSGSAQPSGGFGGAGQAFGSGFAGLAQATGTGGFGSGAGSAQPTGGFGGGFGSGSAQPSGGNIFSGTGTFAAPTALPSA